MYFLFSIAILLPYNNLKYSTLIIDYVIFIFFCKWITLQIILGCYFFFQEEKIPDLDIHIMNQRTSYTSSLHRHASKLGKQQHLGIPLITK